MPFFRGKVKIFMDLLFVSLWLSFSKHAGDKSLSVASPAKVCGPCMDVESAGVSASARARVAQLEPLCMLISGKVQPFSKKVTSGVLEKVTGGLTLLIQLRRLAALPHPNKSLLSFSLSVRKTNLPTDAH